MYCIEALAEVVAVLLLCSERHKNLGPSWNNDEMLYMVSLDSGQEGWVTFNRFVGPHYSHNTVPF